MFTEKADYEICLKGHLDEHWIRRFEGLSLRTELDQHGAPITILAGCIDQSTLHGVLARIRDIGIPVISINCVSSK